MKRAGGPRVDEVFLSHSSRDHAIARAVVQEFKRHGIRCWFAPSRLRGADRWHDEIGKALARCDWFVVLLSPQSVRAEWVRRELQYALTKERFHGKILPVTIKSCNAESLSWTLPSFQIVDLRKRTIARWRSLFATWNIEYIPKPRRRKKRTGKQKRLR